MASCSIYPSRPDRSRRNRATRVSYPAEFSRKRCLLPGLSNLDLLPDLDAARSSRLRCCPGWGRKIPFAMVAPSDESCPLALAARARPGRLRIISGRRRLSHRRCRPLAIAALLVSAVSPRLILRRVKIPGAAFIASIAYSAYLVQKLVIYFVTQFCVTHHIALTSAAALFVVELCAYAVATVLFLVVERPFLQLRHRVAPRPSRT